MYKSLLFSVVIALSAICLAQSESATLSGRVTDPGGSAVVGAEVVLTNIETNVESRTKTNSAGLYVFTGVHPGKYRVAAGATGFKVLIKDGLVLHVQDELAENFALTLGTVSETVTVTADATPVNTTDGTVSTVIDRQFAENLPLNGRSFQTLIQLTPGVVLTPSSPSDAGQFSVNGQRSSSNYWTVDGVSANVGMTTFATTGNAAGGATAGFAVQGGTNSLVSVDALQEFRIQTSTFAPEFGRTPGGQISIVTRSGTNQFHGTVFDYFRHDALDANDWFANNAALPKPEERQNDFGGTISGSIFKDRTFFFLSYEGLRLQLPQVGKSIVPSVAARQNAVAVMQPFLNAFPVPNGPAAGVDANEFNSSFSNKSTLDAVSLRVDHTVNSKLALFARYNYSPSDLVQRGSTLSNKILSRIVIQTGTVGAVWTPTSTMTNDFRFNYSRTAAGSSNALDTFGGAVPVPDSDLPLPTPLTTKDSQFALTIAGAAGFSVGKIQSNTQRQVNLVNSTSIQRGSHSLKFGIDYRRLSPTIDPNLYTQNLVFIGLPNTEAGDYAGGSVGGFQKADLVFKNLGLFGQDTWRVTPRLTLTYGLRWDVDFAPGTASGPNLASATGVDLHDLSGLALAPDGTPIFHTRFGNVAPRVGVAYQIVDKPGRETVLRGGFGIFYDLATQELGSAIAGVYPYAAGNFFGGGSFPPPGSDIARPVPSVAELSNNSSVQLFDPNLELPYTRQWNVALEQSLGAHQSVSATYLGAVGRRLIQTVGVFQPNSTFVFPFLTVNAGTSDYNALQIQFQRRLSHGVQAISSYTWSHSIDTSSSSSTGNTSNVFATQLGIDGNRGPSSFDIRHGFSTAITWDVPTPKMPTLGKAILRDWSLENVFQGRTAPPVDVQFSQLSFNFEPAAVRPDVVPGVPFYLADPTVAGGKRLNPAAFTPPPFTPAGCDPNFDFPCSPARQGNLGRNALRGFGAFQWDFAFHRDIPIHEQVKLQFRAEFFNLLNHPNFGNPVGDLSNPAAVNPQFGLSTQMLGRSLGGSNVGGGGLNALYQIGGPRSVQFALKVRF